MTAIQISLQEQEDTALSQSLFYFIDHYMPVCKPETYALIYIYAYRLYMLGGASAISLPEIAGRFFVKEDFVVSALRHWEAEGLLKLNFKNGEMRVTLTGETKPEPKTVSKIVGEIKPAVQETKPLYTAEEMAFYREQSEDIKKLFGQAERTLGKMLNYNDMNVLFGLYDWLRLPLDVILYLLAYCADHGHRNLRYIEKAALDWADNEIDDLEKALEYVQRFDRHYRGILQVMGQNTGYPTPSQRKYMDKWLNEYKMPSELIMEACDRSGIHIGKPKFNYVDKIMTDWHTKGIKTITEAAADTADFRKKTDEQNKEKAKPAQKKNRFVNYKQRTRDYEQLEKMEREYLAEKIKTNQG